MGKYLKFLSLVLLCLGWPSEPSHVHASLSFLESSRHQLEKHAMLNVQHAAAWLEEETDKTEDQREAPLLYGTFAQVLSLVFAPVLNTGHQQTGERHNRPPRFILFRAILI